MGYAISIGGGLLVGIGLMIWALRERSKRHKAERAADTLKMEAKALRMAAEENALEARKAEDFAKAVDGQLMVLRKTLNETRQRLVYAASPKVVKEWLDKELSEEEL